MVNFSILKRIDYGSRSIRIVRRNGSSARFIGPVAWRVFSVPMIVALNTSVRVIMIPESVNKQTDFVPPSRAYLFPAPLPGCPHAIVDGVRNQIGAGKVSAARTAWVVVVLASRESAWLQECARRVVACVSIAVIHTDSRRVVPIVGLLFHPEPIRINCNKRMSSDIHVRVDAVFRRVLLCEPAD